MRQKHGVSTLHIVHIRQHSGGVGTGNFIRRIVTVYHLLTVLKHAHVAVAKLQDVRLRAIEHVRDKAGCFVAEFRSGCKSRTRSAHYPTLNHNNAILDHFGTVGITCNINASHQARGQLTGGKIGFYQISAHVRTSIPAWDNRPAFPAALPARR